MMMMMIGQHQQHKARCDTEWIFSEL